MREHTRPNPYAQVAMTYYRRSMSSWVTIAFVFGGGVFAMFAVLARRDGAGDFDFLMSFYAVLGFLGLPMWVHFWEQYCGPRRRLLPGFVRVHFTVFALFATLIFIVFPAAVIVRQGLGSVGLLVVAIAIFAVMGWGGAIIGNWALWLLALLCVPVLSPPARQWMTGFIAGRHESLAISLLAAAVVAAIVPLLVLARRSEETRWPGTPAAFDRTDTRERMTGQSSEAWNARRRIILRRPRQWKREDYAPGKSLWARSRRWGSAPGWSLFAMAIFMPGIMIPACILCGGPADGALSSLFPGLAILTMFSPHMFAQIWMGQWRFLEADLLRPIAREDFLKEIGMAMAKQFAVQAVTSVVCLVAAIALFARPHFTPMTLIALIVAFLGIQTFGGAALVLALRHRSPARLAFMAMPLVLLGSLLFLPVCNSTFSSFAGLSAIGGIVLAGLGIFITRAAYRRWLVAELG